MLLVYSREDEIRDARDKRCTGHGWTSVRGNIYMCINIQSAIFFLLGVTSAFKGGTADGEGSESRTEEEGAEDSEGWSGG